MSSVDEVWGSGFGRPPITIDTAPPTEAPPAKAAPPTVSPDVHSSMPYDTATKPPPVRHMTPASLDPKRETFSVRERFSLNPTGGGDDSKLDRLLKLVEQNKTGYAPATTQDMLLYIATGVFFLFTFDTFVTLGKSMRGR